MKLTKASSRAPLACPQSHRRQVGFSLVELMVALVVGMVVIGALMASFAAMSVNNRHSQAMAQMTEDASTALNMLRANLSLAGYSRPSGAPITANGMVPKVYSGVWLRGCNGTFDDLSLAIGNLTCTAGAGTPKDSLAVAYEADAVNSVASGGVPLDCLGNALTQVAGPPAYYLGYNRFFIDGGALKCRGDGSNVSQPLVENIHGMKVMYKVVTNLRSGVPAAWNDPSLWSSYYASPAALGTDYSGVTAVRICLIVKSSNEVMDAITSYKDCDQTDQTPTDKRMYRAFTTTVALQNNLGAI